MSKTCQLKSRASVFKRIGLHSQVLWCRVVHGHVMVCHGTLKGAQTLWECARCPKIELLKRVK